MPRTTKTTKTTKAASPAPKSRAKKAATSTIEEDLNGKSLVIVESPAKAKTIRKILGNNFYIKASVGHIRDLPEKKLGVDVDKDFEPLYEVMPDKADIVQEIQEAAARCDKVYLAADPDREGEAIAWHIASLLKLPKEKVCRIEFHEITKNAIQEAMKHPRQIDLKRVDAQQARRVLDRLVGYKLSPLLWKKVTKGLSAGRVQSVAVRLICEREEEVQAFVPEEYWTIHSDVSAEGYPPFNADLFKVDGQKPNLPNEAAAQAVVAVLKANPLSVSSVTERESKRNPIAPFITSSLQREASTRFGYPVKKTMQIAQKLYEGMDMGAEGPVGLITYMRTDSTRISDEAQAEAKDYILKAYGPEYYPSTPRVYLKKGKNVQDAHEAIRPTSVFRTPDMVRAKLTDEQYRLYKIIWDRFVASQMESARLKTKTVEMAAGNLLLKTSQTHILFPGYMTIYRSEEDDAAEEKAVFPKELTKGMPLKLLAVNPKQHFTEPPPRFNEASLVKTLEELGIGRPSTYAPTIATVQDRGYVRKEEKALVPTELGKTVNQLLVKHFKDIVDVHFTAHMESLFDEIAEDHLRWQGVIRDFYEPFDATLKRATKEMEKVDVIIDNEVCPDCGKPMALKTSWFGSHFLGCTGYPDCKTIKRLTKDQKPVPDDKPTDEICHECQSSMVIRWGRYGEYLACSSSECKGKRPLVKKTGVTCPKCQQGEIIERKSGRGKVFFGCQTYPACDFTVWNKPVSAFCPECNSLMVEKVLKKGTFHACSSKDCKHVQEVAS
jgi:DNA topoisomerase-1